MSDAPTPPPTVRFRPPPTAMIGVFALAVCATPVAFAAPGLQLIYLVPIGLAWALLRLRTVAGPDGITARGPLRSHRLSWDQLRRLRVSERSWVRAVLDEGEEVTLPAVRTRDLPVLAEVSGGRIADPSRSEPAAGEPDTGAGEEAGEPG